MTNSQHPFVSSTTALRAARGLLVKGEERDNPEYLRGMTELIARLWPDKDLPTGEQAQDLANYICKVGGIG